jgi:hypothetical protein
LQTHATKQDDIITVTYSSLLKLIVLATLSFVAMTTFAQATKASAELKLFWSKTIPGQMFPSNTVVIYDFAHDRRGRIAMLSTNGTSQVVLMNPSTKDLGHAVELTTKALVTQIALGPERTCWLGGRINQRAWVPGGDIADAYLGRFDQQGHILSEYIAIEHMVRT